MSDVGVSAALPYHLRIRAGEYPNVRVEHRTDHTVCRRSFHPAADTVEEQELQALKLLSAINRLLRWYRCLTTDETVIELTPAEASPFRFEDEEGTPWGPNHGQYGFIRVRPSRAVTRSIDDITRELSAALDALENEPVVWRLLLLDAEVAAGEGRHREAVLLSWSAIESCFETCYRRLVDSQSDRLAALAPEDRQALTNHRDMSLLNRMTAGLALVAGHSLPALMGKQSWSARRVCYRVRNSVIHTGAPACEEEAWQCLRFAVRLVDTLEPLSEG